MSLPGTSISSISSILTVGNISKSNSKFSSPSQEKTNNDLKILEVQKNDRSSHDNFHDHKKMTNQSTLSSTNSNNSNTDVMDKLNSYKWSLSDFELSSNPLSVNSFAQVYLGRFKKESCLKRKETEEEESSNSPSIHESNWVAIKVWDKYQLSKPRNDSYRKAVIQERQILSKLSSTNINSTNNVDRNDKCWTVQLYMSFVDSHNLYMVMNFWGDGNYLNYNDIDRSKPWMITHYISEILSALEWIHFQHGVVHGDLKPSNILVTHGHTIKLIDFGAAITVNSSSTDNNNNKNNTDSISSPAIMMGTADYVAPEVLVGNTNNCTTGDYADISYLCARDIWSLGCIIYYLYMGKSPFYAESDYLAMEKVLSPSFSPLKSEIMNNNRNHQSSSKIPQAARQVIQALLIRHPPRIRMGAMDHHHEIYKEKNQYISLRQMDFFSSINERIPQQSYLATLPKKSGHKLLNNIYTNHNCNKDYGPMIDGALCGLDFFAT